MPLWRRTRTTRVLTASTLLTFTLGGVVNLDPFSLNAWAAQAAAREAAQPTDTAAGLRQDSLDATAAQAEAEHAEAVTQAAQDAKNNVTPVPPVVGLPDPQLSPTSPQDAAIEAAQRAAQSSGEPVVVNALTTETSLTTAQPDGTLSTQTTLGPVRHRTDGGTGADVSGKATWTDVDLSLTGTDSTGRTTAESAGPWAARLAGTSGNGMVAVGPAGQTISWSPQAASSPVGVGGPGGALPAVKPTAPTAGVTPVVGGIDVQVPPAPDTPPAQATDASAAAPTSRAAGPGASSSTSPARESRKAAADPTTAAGSSTGSDAGTEAGSDAGSEAVFPDALKGGRDFTVNVTATGAEESVVLASRAEVTAAGGANAAAVYRDTFTLPTGVTVRQAPARDGVDPTSTGVEFVDAAGTVVATFGGGKAYDASSNEVGEPATTAVATRLLAATTGTSSATGSATVEVSIDPTWVADSARVFPVTIDPHIATGTGWSGSTGANGSASVDAYVDQAFPTVNEGVQDSGRLLAGYRPINGGTSNSATLVRFGLGDLAASENTVLSAQLSLWNNYSYSCTATPLRVDAALSGWDPATVTWNTGPQGAGIGVVKSFAHGYSSACAAAAETYDVTPIVQKWSNGTTGYYAGLANNGFVITADTTATSGYKRFNSAETGSGMPGLTVTWENCTNYPATGGGTRKVCGLIRDNFAAHGTVPGYGTPSTDELATPDGAGRYNHFSLNGDVRSIYYSAPTGAHNIQGLIRSKWADSGWETGPMGYPATDELKTPSGQGFYNHFAKAGSSTTYSIYYTPATGAQEIHGLIRDRWAALGWEAVVGYPATSELAAPGGGGKVNYFQAVGADGAGWAAPSNPANAYNGAIYYKSGAAQAFSVHGRIWEVYRSLGETASWLGYPVKNEFHPTVMPGGGAAPADAKQSTFENGIIYGDPRNGYTAIVKTAAATMQAPRVNQHTARRLPLEFTINAPVTDADTGATGVDWSARLTNPIVQWRRGAKAPVATGAGSTYTSLSAGSVWTTIKASDLYWPDGTQLDATNDATPIPMDIKNQTMTIQSGHGVGRLSWDAGKALGGQGGILDVRIVFTDSTTGKQVPIASVGGVEYDPDAGQSGSTAVGPGSVNLLTGAYDLSATDASAFGVSITRTASSRRTDAGSQNPAGSAFGPQWAVGGVDEDVDVDWTSIRQTSAYSLDVMSADGEATSFVVDDAGTTWYPEDGAEDLKLVPSGPNWKPETPFKADTWTLTDGEGTVTTFGQMSTVNIAGASDPIQTNDGTKSTWQTTGVIPAAASSAEGNAGADAAKRNATRYAYTQQTVSGATTWRPSRIEAANPALTDAQQTACLSAATPGAGCRVLQLNWGTTPDNKFTRVLSISLYATDPAGGATSPATLATYSYDGSGRLASVTDRAGLQTLYGYGADYTAARGTTSVVVPAPVTSLTPPRELPWAFEYDTTGAVTSAHDAGQVGAQGRLLTVSRDTLAPYTTDTTNGTSARAKWNLVYGVPLDVTAWGAYPMSAAAATTWGQDTPPLDATAVFGPTAQADAFVGDHDAYNDAPSKGNTGNATARNWSTAAVTYLDVNGHTINVAAPSKAAGKWVPSGTWDPNASTSANLNTATDYSLDGGRNSDGVLGPTGTGGTSPGTNVVAIPARGARITAALVDDAGNTTLSLTAANRALALGQDDVEAVAAGAAAAKDQLVKLSGTVNLTQLQTWQRAQLLSTQTRWVVSTSALAGPQVNAPAEVAATTVAPLKLTITKDGIADGSATAVPARSVTKTTYDQNRPTDATVSELPTTVTTGFISAGELMATTTDARERDSTGTWQTTTGKATSFAGVSGLSTASVLIGSPVHDVRTTTTTYAWSGVAAGKPTKVITSSTYSGETTETRTAYDVFGRTIAVSMPIAPGPAGGAAPDGAAASTIITRYYGSGTGTNDCTSDPTGAANTPAAFGGLVCSTGPGSLSGIATPGLPTTFSSYSTTGQPTRVEEKVGTTVLRATVNTYDGPSDRLTQTTVTTQNALGVSAGTEVKNLTYDGAGNVSTVDDGKGTTSSTVTTLYDALGRVYSATDATGLTTKTSYDSSGRVAATQLIDNGAASRAGYSALTAGKTWTATNTYESTTGDLIASTDEAPAGQASTGPATMRLDLDARTVQTRYTNSGFTNRTVYDTTGVAIRRTVSTGSTTSSGAGTVLLDDASTADIAGFGQYGGGESTYGQQIESTQILTAIPLDSAGNPVGTGSAAVSTQTRHRRYTYDGFGRLVAAADSRIAPAVPGSTTCAIRSWAYDADSNQAGKGTTANTAGACAATGYPVPSTSTASGTSKAWTHAYNALDQITDAGYTYDGLGRTLAVPAASPGSGTGGNLPATATTAVGGTSLAVTYNPGDMVASQTLAASSGNETQTFTLDPTGDRLLASTTTLSGTVTTITNRYNDSDDNPALLNEADGSVSRYITGPDANLNATATLKADGTSALSWQVINLHGDVVANLSDSSTAAIATPSTDEFGMVIDTTPTRGNTSTSRYDWLGGKQRSTNARGGLTLMGARLYNPGTSRFLSVDPIFGGNANAYVYPNDPVGSVDLDGHQSKDADPGGGGGAGSGIRITGGPGGKLYSSTRVGQFGEDFARANLEKTYGKGNVAWSGRKSGAWRTIPGVGERRYDAVAFDKNGRPTYYEVKANSARLSKRQKQADAWMRAHGYRVKIIRVTVDRKTGKTAYKK
ncbi:DNRLRE domain-containing protein [Kineococcus aurantiacus]|uniref:RHS repeat-associated protein n=1 Tax=Kineococcus aurantiacus TaxID=37633 RepID=A0A7Y9J374_9ACTN|nr:DNRLRE domain-containing protein [Kineococcus aurantiacus]NYD25026.1 RHS repeat-associated protein [Kineococcus aurantiacus]